MLRAGSVQMHYGPVPFVSLRASLSFITVTIADVVCGCFLQQWPNWITVTMISCPTELKILTINHFKENNLQVSVKRSLAPVDSVNDEWDKKWISPRKLRRYCITPALSVFCVSGNAEKCRGRCYHFLMYKGPEPWRRIQHVLWNDLHKPFTMS